MQKVMGSHSVVRFREHASITSFINDKLHDLTILSEVWAMYRNKEIAEIISNDHLLPRNFSYYSCIVAIYSTIIAIYSTIIAIYSTIIAIYRQVNQKKAIIIFHTVFNFSTNKIARHSYVPYN